MTENCREHAKNSQQILDLKDQVVEVFNKIERLTENLHELKVMEEIKGIKINDLIDKLDTLSGKFDEITSKSGKRWESIVGGSILAIIGGAVSLFFAKLGNLI